ncbi:transposase [uncultured Chitinophaga sp.]|uniref:transposase n=1 Tax=uncultured Chitinophaga sp. TaxID=339340 RepID=UPI0025E831B4|nr:transposase [uncultured Chitinophaga sp.]
MTNIVELSTMCCYKQQALLTRPEHKKIIINSLKFLVKEKRIVLYGFVIMPRYVQVLWQKQDEWKDKNVQQMFSKYTAQKIKHYLKSENLPELESFRSNRTDRIYQFWERNGSKKIILTYQEAQSELMFMHIAPCDIMICKIPQHYHYSSAKFYYSKVDQWKMLTDISEHLQRPSGPPPNRPE